MSSSECSEVLSEVELEVSEVEEEEGSTSADLEQYSDDGFDDYSDSFEAEDTDRGAAGEDREEEETPTARAEGWGVGTRVQVFWQDENEWFDGVVRSVDHKGATRCFVRYDDGEEAWEDAASIRGAPTVTVDLFDQLQLLSLTNSMVGRRAMVYWPSEREWYNGAVTAVQNAALRVEYDDGDSRWEQGDALRYVLVARAAAAQLLPPPPPVALDNNVESEPSFPPPPRVLYARPYQRVVAQHFEPVRIPRPYYCVAEHHTNSEITPRRPYTERKFLHAVHEMLECTSTSTSSSTCEKVECGVQATLSFPEM